MSAIRSLLGLVLLLALALPASGAEDDILHFLPAVLAANPAAPPCAGQIPAEAAADGDYRAFVTPIATEHSNPKVAMARNGWRALVLSDNGLDLFDRDHNAPVGRIAVNETYTASMAMAQDGSAFVVGDMLWGSSRLRYFECDRETPEWTWVSDGGSWPKVAAGAKGKWVAIATTGPEYVALFRRDRHRDGVAVPVFLTELDWRHGIREMAFSGSRPCVAVITSSSYDDEYRLYLFGRNGPLWSRALVGSRWTVPDGIFVDMSSDGNYIAVGGFGGLVRFFSTRSPEPLWTLSVDSDGEKEVYISDIEISADGSSLAILMTDYDWVTPPGVDPDVPRDILCYIRDTSKDPNSGQAGMWSWYAGEGFSWRGKPTYSTPVTDIVPYYLNVLYLHSVAISEDGQYVFVSGDFHYQDGQSGTFVQNRTGGISFHRDYTSPLRFYLSGDIGVADRHGTISPDGSWVAMAGETNVARFEVAPFEKVHCRQPIQVDIPLIGTWLDLGKVQVDYTIYKTGRACKLRQHWDLFLMPFGQLLGNFLTCTGDFQFQFPLEVAAGNIVFSSYREVQLPSCSFGDAVGIEGYDLFATLKDSAGQTPYSDDQTSVVRFTIPE